MQLQLPTSNKKPIDLLHSRFPFLSKIPTIKSLEELGTTKNKDLPPIHYIKDYLFNSTGEFYKSVNASAPYYLYFFEVPQNIQKIIITKNDIGGTTNSTIKKWPSGGFFYANDKNEFFGNQNQKNFEVKFKSEEADPLVSGINCYRLDLSYIVNDFISINDYSASCNEFKVPKDFAEAKLENTKLLFAVPSKYTPDEVKEKLKVEAHSYNTQNTYYFDELPIAEAIYEGEPLSKSKISFGKLFHGSNKCKFNCIWAPQPPRRLINRGCSFFEYTALCLSPISKDFIGLPHIVDPLYNFWRGRFFNKLKKIKNCEIIGKIKLLVPVYRRVNDKRDVFIWNQPHLVKPEFFRTDKVKDSDPKLNFYTRHTLYPNLFDSYSLEDIYKSIDCFDYITPENAARKIARALYIQPRGRRSVSIEGGALKLLLGGAIELADRTKAVKDTVSPPENDSEEEKAAYDQRVKEAKEKFAKDQRKAKQIKNILCSMVYFDKKNDETKEDCLNGEGYLFYDAPIHYEHPKIKINGNDTRKNLTELCIQRLEKLYGKYKSPISGCEAIKDLLSKIFQEFKRYNIKIDYVYSDFEIMRNTAKEIRSSNRVYNIDKDNDRNTQDLSKASSYQIWQSIWQSLNKLHNDPPQGYKDILFELQKRGFLPYNCTKEDHCELNEVLSCAHSTLTDRSSSNGYNDSSTYEQRRNINIWDCVMMEYTADWFNKYLVEPVRECSSCVIPSMHALNYQAGHINHHQHGEEFETYLGGSINLVSNMRSNPCLYTLKTGVFDKDSMDNWKTYIPEITPFSRILFYVNNVRAARLSNPCIGVHPFISTQYTWNNDVAERKKDTTEISDKLLDKVQESYPYYKEMLIHMWMCNPEITYAYPHYDNDAKNIQKVLKATPSSKTASFETYNKLDYFRDVFGDIQDTIKELDNVLKPRCKSNVLINSIVPENSPFIVSGWKIGSYYVYRLTINNENLKDDEPLFEHVRYIRLRKYGFILPKILKIFKKSLPLKITADGKTIAFPSAFIISKKASKTEPGCWIVSKNSTPPYFKASNDYFETHPSLSMAGISYAPVIDEIIIKSKKPGSTYKTKNQRVFVLDNTSVFGDIAPCQKWIADIKINDISQDTHIFEYRLGEDYKKFVKDHEYTFEMEFDLNKYFQAEDKDKVKFATISCKEKTDVPNSNYIIKKTTYRPGHINTADSNRPFYLLDIIQDLQPKTDTDENTEQKPKQSTISSIKAFIQGANARVDIYRKDDGINIGRVTKEKTNEQFRVAKPGDKIKLKVSWLNATDKEITYTVAFCIDDKLACVCCFNKNPGDEGYKVYDLGQIPAGAKKISAHVFQNYVQQHSVEIKL